MRPLDSFKYMRIVERNDRHKLDDRFVARSVQIFRFVIFSFEVLYQRLNFVYYY